jgi:neutral ceramidase
LFARAIVVDDGHTCAVLMGWDLSKVDATAVKNGVARASASTGCPVENFVVSATHTHSSSTWGMQLGPPYPKEQEDYLVQVVNAAKAKLAPARIGYGTAQVALNVNRELWDVPSQTYVQGPNLAGPSDKTLSVVEFMGADDVPIGVFMNYAMHPINFFLTGVISADFPGEASRYIENLFGGRTVAIFSQAPEGDQNPLFGEFAAQRVAAGEDLVEKIGSGKLTASPMRPVMNMGPGPQGAPGGQQGSPQLRLQFARTAVPPEKMDEFKRGIEITGANVAMMGTLISANAVRLMRDVIRPVDTVKIWGAKDSISCPRGTVDAAGGAPSAPRAGAQGGGGQGAGQGAGRGAGGQAGGPGGPGGGPGGAQASMSIDLGVLRIGDIYWAPVNAEAYSEIGMHLKAASPAAKTIVVALGYGSGGYIRGENATVRLGPVAPGAASRDFCGVEDKIIAKEVELIQRGSAIK